MNSTFEIKPGKRYCLLVGVNSDVTSNKVLDIHRSIDDFVPKNVKVVMVPGLTGAYLVEV